MTILLYIIELYIVCKMTNSKSILLGFKQVQLTIIERKNNNKNHYNMFIIMDYEKNIKKKAMK